MIKFSIIIPTYNASITIAKTIQSCLNQSYQACEIIIVDDCSTDNTVEIIENEFGNFKLNLIKLQVNKGVSNARNIGWNSAIGDYIAFLDSDDTWHLDKLNLMNEIIFSNGFRCLGNSYTNDDKLLYVSGEYIHMNRLSFKKLLIRNYFNTSCLILERSLDYRFNPNMRYTEDHDLLLRISKKVQITFVEVNLTLLGRPQLSNGGLSGNITRMRLGEMKMYIRAIKLDLKIILFLPFLIIFSLVKHIKKYFN